MTNEPVAYLVSQEPYSSARYIVCDKPVPIDNKQITPLYTKEQLQPKVQMTQSEFDEFEKLYKSIKSSTIIGLLNTIRTNEQKNFGLLKLRLNTSGKDLEIVNLWANYNPDNPEETVEIVPDMKWFVRSKEKYHPDMDQGITESGYLYLTQGDIYSVEYHEMTTFKDEATQFNTEDEAKLWTTPDTEAVLLPVEDW